MAESGLNGIAVFATLIRSLIVQLQVQELGAYDIRRPLRNKRSPTRLWSIDHCPSKIDLVGL